MWCSQGKRPVCAEACTGVPSQEWMMVAVVLGHPPCQEQPQSAGLRWAVSSLDVPGCDLRAPGARTYCFKAW
jgi:hypothetical protein